MNSPNIGMMYVASHTHHMGNKPLEIMRTAGDELRLVHVSDMGNAVRVPEHLKIGDGDVNWDEFFGGLKEIGLLNKDNTVMISSVFAEDDNADEVSRHQVEAMNQYIRKSNA